MKFIIHEIKMLVPCRKLNSLIRRRRRRNCSAQRQLWLTGGGPSKQARRRLSGRRKSRVVTGALVLWNIKLSDSDVAEWPV